MTDLTAVDISTARLPSTYQAAKVAISQCARVDECKDWADKASALASYAKQAQDDQLEQMAKRIRARAMRRAGELLKQIEPAHGANQNISDAAVSNVLTRKGAAADAGLSERQAVTAKRLADIPQDVFEERVEAGETVTQMTAPKTSDDGRRLASAVRAYRCALEGVDVDTVVSGLSAQQRKTIRGDIDAIDAIQDQIVTRL